MEKKLNILFARGGTCQAERLLPQLVENNLLISDTQFSDHLRFLYLYSDLLAYYDTNNEPVEQNVWRRFLEQDDTVIRSLILHTNIDRVRKSVYHNFLTLRRNGNQMLEKGAFDEIVAVVLELIILLDYWHKNLPGEDLIRPKLDTIIGEDINTHISKIYKVFKQYYGVHHNQVCVDFCTFLDKQCARSSVWLLKPEIIYSKVVVADPSEEQIIELLYDCFDAFCNTIDQLKSLASHDYFDTLTSQNKEPHIALLIAFLQLLQYADAHLNHLPQRSLDHYYRHVLKFNNNPTIADRAFVHFVLSPGTDFAFVPKGSLLVAKNPANAEEILFKTQKHITVNKARINQINTLVSTTKTDKSGYKTIELFPTSYDASTLQGLPFQCFPTSDNDDSLKENSQLKLATMIGSPLFYLAEGTRTVHIKWKFTVDSFNELICRNLNKELAVAPFLEELARMFLTILQLKITTQAGWIVISEEAVTLRFIHEEHLLHMTIVLDPELPAIDKLPADYNGEDAYLEVPTISLGIGEGVSLISLYLLNGLVLEKMYLKVSVKNYRGLILQNELGLIDNSQIFEPFGPLAKLYSSFYIGSGEVFSKNLIDLKIHITWDSIPMLAGGFKSYYNAYPVKVQNDAFQVSISYLNRQHWYPSSAQKRQQVPLFQVVKGDDHNERLEHFRRIDDINLAALGITKSNYPLDVSVYAPNTLDGFLKLKLTAPDQSFGHSIYPSLMGDILMKNAQKQKGETTVLLNEPYTPRIKSITVDYEAEESISLTTYPGGEEEQYLNRVLHISSFGHSQLFPNKLIPRATFLPWIEDEASFIAFGIADANSDMLALHIEIGQSRSQIDVMFAKPQWFYLADDMWLPLSEAIVIDGTEGCVKSGILTFDFTVLPLLPSRNNTYMAPGYIWLKAQFNTTIDALPTIIGAYLQAVIVSRVLDKSGVFASPVLASHSIEQLQTPIHGIEYVIQPCQTFGGRQYENHQALYRRVSERLRHKNRAISIWDYERLILERFPEILRVKCINHTAKRSNNMMRPGHITLVVIPKVDPSLGIFPVTSPYLLYEIKNYIQGLCSPFVICEVVNPVYEDIKVNVAVKFKSGYEKGLFINVLQNDLSRFLSPWLFDPLVDIQLGGDILISTIIDFINNCHYVDGIGNFSIFKYLGKAPDLKLDKVTSYSSHLCSTYPWSVMVSAKTHKISVLDTFTTSSKLRHGSVEDMAIGEDFIVGPWEIPSEKEDMECADEGAAVSAVEEYCLITQKYIKN